MTKQASVSLIMIVKNEEKLLPRALETIHSLFDEIIVVDTGSTDRTTEIAKEFNASIFSFEWIDDFAAAFNYGLKQAKSDYIFFLEADEYFDESNSLKLKNLFYKLVPGDYAYFIQRSSPDANIGTRVGQILRLFPRYPDIQWIYRGHKRIVESVLKHKPETVHTDIVSYMDRKETEEEIAAKKIKGIELTLQDLKDYPDNGYLYFNLALDYFYLKDYTNTIACCRRSIEVMEPHNPLLSSIYTLLAMSLYFTAQIIEAWNCIETGLKINPANLELLHFEATIHRFNKNYKRAEECLERIINMPHSGSESKPAKLSALHRLAELKVLQNRDSEAESIWRSLVSSNYKPAIEGLAALYEKKGEHQKLKQLKEEL